MKEAFEQLPKESAKAFAAFSVYLNMGPERSLGAVAKELSKSVPLLKRWSRRFDWLGRVQAHEAHLVMVERETTDALTRGKAAERVSRREKILEREYEMHEQCIAAARKELKNFIGDDNRKASLAEIARILETASKLGRLAVGLATDRTEVTGEDGGPVRVEVSLALEKIYGRPLPGEVVDVQEVEDNKQSRLTSAATEGTK
jgi:hypothetical protein